MVESVQTVDRDMQKSDLEEGFKEQKRRKRSSFEYQANQRDPPCLLIAMDQRKLSQLELPTRNFFAPLRVADMEFEHTEENSDRTDGDLKQQSPSSKRGRPPPIILTSAINLIQMQNPIERLCEGQFEFRNTRNEARVVTKVMADFQP
jgi:hypothetical protein